MNMSLFSGSDKAKALLRLQGELDEVKERMRVLDNFAGVGLWQAVLHQGDAMHPQSRWTWSPEFRRLVGFKTESEFPDLATSWSDRLHPDDVEPTFAKFGAHLADRTGRTPYDAVYRLKMRDGSYRWFRATGGCARGPAGEPLRACGSLVDIHTQMTNEEAQKRNAEEQARTVGALANALRHLTGRDLTFRLNETFPPEYEQLRNDFNSAMQTLQQAMLAVNVNVKAIQSGTQEIATASDDLSRRTEQQAATLEQTAAALDEITATMKKSAEGAAHARKAVASADENAKSSALVVKQAVAGMEGIAKSAQQINQIIGVMDEIAFQTNLLALNAGVEAARAGEAGRGFAVVASEVRALAQRSAEAAKEIKGLISTSTAQTDHGVRLVAETGRSLEQILVQVAEINVIITDIAAGAQEQATGLQEVNTAVNQMDQVTQQNATMVEESTASSHSLSQECGALAALVGQFRVGGADDELRGELRKVAPHAFRTQPPPRVAAKPASRSEALKPAARPPRPAVKKVSNGAPVAGALSDGWDEF